MGGTQVTILKAYFVSLFFCLFLSQLHFARSNENGSPSVLDTLPYLQRFPVQILHDRDDDVDDVGEQVSADDDDEHSSDRAETRGETSRIAPANEWIGYD